MLYDLDKTVSFSPEHCRVMGWKRWYKLTVGHGKRSQNNRPYCRGELTSQGTKPLESSPVGDRTRGSKSATHPFGDVHQGRENTERTAIGEKEDRE